MCLHLVNFIKFTVANWISYSICFVKCFLQGGDKLQEAYYTFEELADKLAATPSLLNGQATCLIGQGKYEEAEAKLQEALEKDSNSTETLINMAVLSHLTGKPVDICNRFLNQLNDSAAAIPFLQELQSKEAEYDFCMKQHQPSIHL